MAAKILLVLFITSALAVSTAFPQAEVQKKATEKVLTAEEKAEAQSELDEALDIAKRAKEIGDEGQAFLLYTDALLRLRKMRGKYHDFKAKEVNEKIKEVRDTLKGLEDAKCASLEQEKAGRFRFLVWKRQLLILDKLDKIEQAVAENDDMLDEIKDKLGI